MGRLILKGISGVGVGFKHVKRREESIISIFILILSSSLCQPNVRMSVCGPSVMETKGNDEGSH